MNGKITYHQQVTYCGKPRCRKCREGIGHGPYWYAYQTVNGQTTRTYVGKTLPPDVQASLEINPPGREVAAASASALLPFVPSSVPSDYSSAMLRILTFGQFRLERYNGQQWQAINDSAWQQRQVRALLAYLICSPERRASRSQIIATLWPNSDIEAATNRLNKTLQNLRKVLGHPSVERSTGGTMSRTAPSLAGINPLPLRAEGEWLSLVGQEHVSIDADTFDALLTRASAPDLATDDQQRERLLREAMTLYGGDFLPEERSAGWVVARRQILQRSWSELLLQLADLFIARKTMAAAIDVLDRLIASDPTNEPAVQRLVVALAGAKRRGEALRAYHRFVEVLQDEFQALPSEETRALFEVVRQGGELAERAELSFPPLLSDLASSPSGAPAEALPFSPPAHQAGPTLTPALSFPPATRQRAVPLETIGRTRQSPLVGRTFELEAMRAVLLDVEQSTRMQLVSQRRASGIPLDTQRRPQCLLLMGESGIGKTRLAEEMSREALRRHWTVAWSHIHFQESSIPYRLWTETLRRILNVDTGLLLIQEPALLQPLTPLLPDLYELLPAVRETAPAARMLPPEQELLRIWEAVCDLLKAASESAPLLIVLDDIQWADASSHELLGYLARHLYGYPVLLVGTCRDTELPTRPPHPLRSLIAHMQREHSVMTLNIEPLTSEQIGELVTRVSSLPEAAVRHIQDHAAGNPFFAEELARSAPPTLPKTVAAALDHRMSRLSQPCRQLLGNAAVLGGSFEFPFICAMEANNLPDEDIVLSLLEEALQAGVLTEEGTGTRITYHFWHPLLVSHLYDGISAVRRARLHLRAAEILKSTHAGRVEDMAATITHHLVRADADYAQIVYYAEMAADHAYSISAYSEAEQHYHLAVDYIERAEMDTGRPGEVTTGTAQTRLASLLERLADCTMIRGNFAEARTLYERLLSAQHYEPQIQALLWAEIAWTWRLTGDNARARQACSRGELILRNAGIVGGPVWARLRYSQASIYWQSGDYDEAQRIAQEALDLFARFESRQKQQNGQVHVTRITRIQRRLEGDPVDLGSIHRLLGSLANAMGQRTQALAHLNTALALYEQYDDMREIAHVSCNLGYVYLKKAEVELAQAALRRALNLAERVGDDPLISVIFSDLGELAAASSDLDEAEACYRHALTLAERFNDREYISGWNAALASVLQDQGKLDEAARCIKRALSIGRAMHNAPRIGTALVALGNMRITQAIAAQKIPRTRARLLARAGEDLQRALALEGLEVETRTRGELAQAHIAFLLGKTRQGHGAIEQVIAEAQRYQLALVETSARQLLTLFE